MKSSCIRHPENNRYIQLNEWQLRFCQGNHCAALLLSFFINWHEWKLKNDQYYRKSNDIAEAHGDGRPSNESAYLFFTMEELIEGTMNFYGKNAINEAIQFLVSLNVVTVHKNPNPRYHFDKTKYFQFYPAICNRWIADNYPIEGKPSQVNTQVIDFYDTPKEDDRLSEKGRRSAEIGRPSVETGKAITNTTSNTTNKKNKDQSFQSEHKNFSDSQKQETKSKNTEECSGKEVKEIIDALVNKGMSAEKFTYPDATNAIETLHQLGATAGMFVEAYDISKRITNGRGFGVNYLVKVVQGVLSKIHKNEPTRLSKNANENPINVRVSDETDLRNAMNWAGDVISQFEQQQQ